MSLKQTAMKLTTIYKNNPSIEAIMLAGSVATGWEDEFSDIELHILWKKPPSDDDRKQPIQFINGSVLSYFPFEDGEWSESYLTPEGIKLEISNFLTSTVETFITDVTIHFDMNYDKQCILASIKDGMPLYGEMVINSLKQSISIYPHQLAKRMISENLWLGSRWNNRAALMKRQDRLMLNGVTQDACIKLMGVLFGLNKMYVHHPSFKWLSNKEKEFTVKPENFVARINQFLLSNQEQALKELEDLFADVIRLVHQYHLDLDIEEQKRMIGYNK
ncbi:DUF4037 domain-containing protein [Sutcliffiella rhizosphaerae]|uniref:DUF4037 domain-containing protein n=1 Tax=Sutcliffiella rhizosphaerae TaxID=2880967 RepID=A0ABM8YQV7_9BACI|nr:DUF4037 domain-containing protein [Sutcliffiella rhizosphaerae]CAG9622389.1 hypothetical protein BACCIP111883_03180 [Sutcliffiella rhizosphaerae]